LTSKQLIPASPAGWRWPVGSPGGADEQFCSPRWGSGFPIAPGIRVRVHRGCVRSAVLRHPSIEANIAPSVGGIGRIGGVAARIRPQFVDVGYVRGGTPARPEEEGGGEDDAWRQSEPVHELSTGMTGSRLHRCTGPPHPRSTSPRRRRGASSIHVAGRGSVSLRPATARAPRAARTRSTR
jgi:hypothetical protein